MQTYTLIKKDKQIWKFCFYGFFKNLKFFEPYLIVYLLSLHISLFEIGTLYAIREIVTYIFEVPSGIIADHYGKKKELLLCFTFYILSFILFFLAGNYMVLSAAMLFFGLGEAFRSGTHKAMILTYLEHMGWYEQKGFVYGRTRSFSLVGSSLSSFLSILFVFNLPAMKWLFIVCILPYLADFLLILSYPSYLDERKDTELTLSAFYKASIESLKRINRNQSLKKILLSSAAFDGIFKSVKDYIQPILSTLLIVSGAGLLMTLSDDKRINVMLGLTYGIFYIFSSIASKNMHKLTDRYSSGRVFNVSYIIFSGLLLLLAVAIHLEFIPAVLVIFFFLYMLKDARRPVFVDYSSDFMTKDQRATVLSVESQIRAVLVTILAPLLGLIADKFSISSMFIFTGCFMFILSFAFSLSKIEEEKPQ